MIIKKNNDTIARKTINITITGDTFYTGYSSTQVTEKQDGLIDISNNVSSRWSIFFHGEGGKIKV
jgi:hypothetical protein